MAARREAACVRARTDRNSKSALGISSTGWPDEPASATTRAAGAPAGAGTRLRPPTGGGAPHDFRCIVPRYTLPELG